MGLQNWRDFDPSEYVQRTNKFWKMFIGSQEEFDLFVEQFKDNE